MEYIISFGANIGNKVRNIEIAIGTLFRFGVVRKTSRVYLTEPIGCCQPWFLNGAVLYETDLTPLDLLKCLKSIELNIGRIDRGRWAPREIDLDIIWFSGGEFSHSDLEIPHPRWMERRFVIEPLIDLGFSVLCGIELLDHLQNLMHQVVIPVPCISMRILNLVCNFGSDSLFCENFKK